MTGALFVTLPLALVGVAYNNFWPWGITGVLGGGLFNLLLLYTQCA